MTEKRVLVIDSDNPGTEQAGEAIEDLGQRYGLSADRIFKLTLAVDELATNTLSYGFDADHPDKKVLLELSVEDGMLIAILRDRGRAFDPLAVAEPDIDLSLDQRAIGGLGIMLARQATDTFNYRRDQDCNIVTLILRLPDRTSPTEQ